jgi:hypothetical protein
VSLIENRAMLNIFANGLSRVILSYTPHPPHRTVCTHQIAFHVKENASRNLPRIKAKKKIEQKSTIRVILEVWKWNAMWKTFSVLAVLCFSTMSHRQGRPFGWGERGTCPRALTSRGRQKGGHRPATR